MCQQSTTQVFLAQHVCVCGQAPVSERLPYMPPVCAILLLFHATLWFARALVKLSRGVSSTPCSPGRKELGKKKQKH